MTTTSSGRLSDRTTIWGAFLEYVALVGFAVSPLFDLFGRYPELLVANGLGGFEIVLLSVVLGFALPLAFIVVEAVLARTAPGLDRGFHVAIVAAGAAIISLQLTSRLEAFPASLCLLASGIAGVAAAWGYLQWLPAAGLLRFLALGALVFPGYFLFHSPAGDLLRFGDREIESARAVERPTPIILIVMDELPLISLLDRNGEIDRVRYPSFARLADDATWYPETATTAGFTTTAVPALLTGSYPDQYVLLTTFDEFPHNLFALLQGHYRFHAFESVTHLCPDSICEAGPRPGSFAKVLGVLPDVWILYLHLILPASLRADLPDVENNWRDFGAAASRAESTEADARKAFRKQRADQIEDHNRNMIQSALHAGEDFERFLGGIRRKRIGKPTLHFFHMILPHPPFRYLPSGRSYPPGPDFQYGLDGVWGQDGWEPTQAQQRHLLQVGYVDRLLGRLLDRLQEAGIYDEAIVAVISDHGVSFLPETARRHITVENQGETLLVPFLLKLPGQKKGKVDERGVATVDLLPTLADAIGADIPWPVDGRSALQPDPPPRGDVEAVPSNRKSVTRYPRDALRESKERLLVRKLEIFGNTPGNEGLYEIGFAPELLGRPLSEVEFVKRRSNLRVQLHRPDRYRNISETGPIPSLIAGTIAGPNIGSRKLRLAIVVNGRIAALTRSYAVAKTRYQRFEAMVPESAFERGSNRVEVFRVKGPPRRLKLQRVRGG